MKQKIFYIALIIMLTNAIFAQSKAKEKNKRKATTHKVVMHLTSNDTLVWKSLMNNLKNLKEGWGESVQIEVVTNGLGVQMLMKEKTTQQIKIEDFNAKGIVFYACENTMREKKITKGEMLPTAQFVPMGIGEVILKQEIGWSYIKAGF